MKRVGGAVGCGSSGMTLIETLTVVGIIAVLATLVLKGTSGVVDRARSAKCMANLRQISAGLNTYAADNNGQYPPVRAADQTYWYQVIAPYLEAALKANTNIGDTRNVAKILRCPAARQDFGAPSDEVIYRSYMATDMMRGWKVDPLSGSKKDFSVAVGPVNIAKPASSLLLVDGAKTSSGTDYACDSGQGYSTAKISYRHNKLTSGLFFDGHVALLKAEDITKDMWDSP